MNLYILINEDCYIGFTGAVVAAETEEEARLISPRAENPSDYFDKESNQWLPEHEFRGSLCPNFLNDEWVAPQDLEVKLIGKAEPGIERGLIKAFWSCEFGDDEY